MSRIAFALPLALAAASCSGQTAGVGVPRGAAAYAAIPVATPAAQAQDYRIGPLDTLDITVFQEPELSARAVPVDASGNVALPLVGTVQAAGRTAHQLGAEIAGRLGEKYLEDPQVSVAVAASVSQKVVVQGEVVQPGVFDIKGPTTLLEALSLAKGETRVASLKEVVVFRTVDGKRFGGVFDVASIRRGQAPDPEIVGNDVVVVGYSSAKSLWRDIMTTVPLLNVFRPLG